MDIEIILDANLTPAELADIAVVAEEGGIRTLWHSNFPSTWDAFVALVPAALATRRLRLGVLAVSPFEMHPLKIANAINSLNEIARGRATVAIGGGGAVLSAMRNEGVELDFKALRVVRAVREAVEIVRGAAHGELKRGYAGELFQVTMPYNSSWLKAPPARVFTCSDGPQMIRMGARVADGMQLGDQTIHRAPEIMANVRAGWAKRDRLADDFRIGNYWAWHIKEDKEASRAEARRSVAWRTQLIPPFHGLDFLLDEPDLTFIKDHYANFQKAAYTGTGNIEGVPKALADHVIDSVCSTGDYSDIERELERYRAYADAGFTDLVLKIFDEPLAAVRAISERVVPAV
ncbi:MAG: LLM class flavin-dependent oxidoreductase [Gammaproteobacteria bacterium]|nr:LLM class flavin-dependent oxidoreductase [Gammaproteobacteria bacterium]